MKQVNEYVYLVSTLTRDGNIDAAVKRRVIVGNKVMVVYMLLYPTSRCPQKPRLLLKQWRVGVYTYVCVASETW